MKELEVHGGSIDRDSAAKSEKVSRFYEELYIEEVKKWPILEELEWSLIAGTKANWLESLLRGRKLRVWFER